MSTCVVEVGPAGVRGPGGAAGDVVQSALDCLDDEIALLDEQPVAVDAIWREIFRSVLPDQIDSAVLVCPTWWPPRWVTRVEAAAASRSTDVDVVRRADALTQDKSEAPTVVEIAPDLVAVSRAGEVVGVAPRDGPTEEVVTAVVSGVVGSVGSTATVVLDAPLDVPGADVLAASVSALLRFKGVAVRAVSPDLMQPNHCSERIALGSSQRHRGRRVLAVVIAALSVGLLCVGVSVMPDAKDSAAEAMPMTLLVEGRVALKVPALWTVRRITSGSGSARIAVSAPNQTAAVLVTQSQMPGGETLASVAATLRRALDDERPGVFDGFAADGRRADRDVVTYRENRQDRQIEWAVFVDDSLRIAIGCQSASGSAGVVRDACDEAIRSAHAIL